MVQRLSGSGFMGDTGSLALGGILGVAAVLLRREVLLALVGGIFVAETLSVILQVASYKLRDKKDGSFYVRLSITTLNIKGGLKQKSFSVFGSLGYY